jgi:hypothetical protein
MKRKTVRVHDKMQRDYAYELVVAPGRSFAEGFKPERCRGSVSSVANT